MDNKSFFDKKKKELTHKFLEIEKRTDISESEKVDLIIRNTSLACSAIAIQPIPFADILILTPMQAYMGSRIATIKGIPLNESEDLIKEVLGTLGMAVGAQQLALSLYKLGLPGLGGFMTIPLVYGLTYGIGSVMDYYFTEKRKNSAFKLTEKDIHSLWKTAKNKGVKIGKKIKSEKPKQGILTSFIEQLTDSIESVRKVTKKAEEYTRELNESAEKYHEQQKIKLEEKRRIHDKELKEFKEELNQKNK